MRGLKVAVVTTGKLCLAVFVRCVSCACGGEKFGFGPSSDVTISRPNSLDFSCSIEVFGVCTLNSMYGSSIVANVLVEHSRFHYWNATEQIELDNPKDVCCRSWRMSPWTLAAQSDSLAHEGRGSLSVPRSRDACLDECGLLA